MKYYSFKSLPSFVKIEILSKSSKATNEASSCMQPKSMFTIYNLGRNIWRLFPFLAQFFFTTSETELDYYHQKVSVRVASRVAEQLKTCSEVIEL